MSKKKKDWKIEKERLLGLDREVRRKEYRRHEYVPLEKIPTWRQGKVNEKEEGNEVAGGERVSDKVSLYKGDITILEVDAIVNAANSSLLGGGGVDGCIHRAAGSCLYDECHSLNGCETGKAKITCGYDLPAKYVIHTVGPVARGHVGQTETADLTSCYQNSLQLVKEHGLKTVAFPCISTGIYGFPNEPAAEIALNTVKSWIEKNHDKITRVIFCVFLETDFAIYKRKMSQLFHDNDKEVTEGQPKEGNTPPSKKSRSKDQSEDGHKDDVESGDEEEPQNDSVDKEVVMGSESQNPDKGSAHEEEPNDAQEKDKDKQGDDEDKDRDEDDEKEVEGQAEPKTGEEEEDKGNPEDMSVDGNSQQESQVEAMAVDEKPEENESGNSNGEMKAADESLQESDSISTNSTEPKDPVEKRE